MKALEQKILTEGKVLPGNVLKVGSFLNQQMDSDFIMEIGLEIARLYAAEKISKVLTVESSGIALAVAAGIAARALVICEKAQERESFQRGVYGFRLFVHARRNVRNRRCERIFK